MRKVKLIIVLLLTSWSTCCVADADDDKALIFDMQSTASMFVKTLGKTLKTTINSKGPTAAISVCKTVAPNLANQLSRETGWKISRVSLKVRNPLIGTPDTWERKQLIAFSNDSFLDSSKSGLIETYFVEDETEYRSIRYMRALPTGPICLTCHGRPKDIPDEVASALEQLYPHDKAIGYSLGDIRGAISIQVNRN
ncbi:MAG: DUF3365 domain-containing protein [Burkholderiales bacterium]|nr:DUF3365 domain-containing protein [Burkholderiales bacterium]|tara:strand:+ start:12915 stop:13502 length:588 start_codon:yes stop_codon:yes gene_type:complete